jgi:hypothetical protein
MKAILTGNMIRLIALAAMAALLAGLVIPPGRWGT